MGKPRLELSKILHEILEKTDSKYSKHCYFVKPSEDMKYPCIKYEESNQFNRNADNKKYLKYTKYTLTVIDPNPESMLRQNLEKEEKIQFLSFDRLYVADNLWHFVYTLYF